VKYIGNARIHRWAMLLSEFMFNVVYRRGCTNGNADSISRVTMPDSAPPDGQDADDGTGPWDITPHCLRSTRAIHATPHAYAPTPMYMRARCAAVLPFPSATHASLGACSIEFHSNTVHRLYQSTSVPTSSSSALVRSMHATRRSRRKPPQPSARGDISADSDADVEANTNTDISLIDLSQLQDVIEEQHSDAALQLIIEWLQFKRVPKMHDTDAQRKFTSAALSSKTTILLTVRRILIAWLLVVRVDSSTPSSTMTRWRSISPTTSKSYHLQQKKNSTRSVRSV
jgi:hypothetical protein